MSKIYKSHELLKAIAEGKIKDGSKFNVYENGDLYFDMPVIYEDGVIRKNGRLLTEFITLEVLSTLSFELIEDEIDIQAIEEFESEYTMNNVEFQIQDKLNELLQAIKQLDRKIKEK